MGAFFSFRSFIFPQLVKIIYWLGLIGIGIGMLIVIVGAISASNNPYLGSGGTGYAVGAVIGAIIGGAILVVVWRVVVELWLVLFSIHEVLVDIRDRD